MAEFNKNEFQTTLLNKAEIEQALGIKIDLKKDDTLNLEYYAMFEYIPLDEVICIFLGLDHNKFSYKKNDRFYTIYKAVETQVRNGILPAKVEQDHDINGYEIQYDISLSHRVAEQWAKTHGLLWNVPHYKAVEISKEENIGNSELLNQLTAKDEEIARLNAEIAELKKADRQSIVDYEQYSIYGHSSELLKIVFEVTKEFWANAETPPKNATIEAWISENYPQKKYSFVSQTVRQYIATILRPQPKLK